MKKLMKIVLLISIAVAITGCTSTEEKVVALQKEFNQKPTEKQFRVLKKYYLKKKMVDQQIALYERYLQAFPKKKRAQKSLGRAYHKKGMKLTGDQRFLYLKKALSNGYQNDYVITTFSKMVDQKLIALDGKHEAQLQFLQEMKPLPLGRKTRNKVTQTLDYLKNREGFEHYLKMLRGNIAKNRKALNGVLKREQINFDQQKELFEVVAAIPHNKSASFNDTVSRKVIDSKIDVLKYALEHFKKPPVDQEIQVVPLGKDAVVCDGGKTVKKQFVRICSVSLQEIARAFFALRKEKP